VQALVLVLTVLVMWSAFTRYQIASDMGERRLELEQEAAALQSQKEELQAEVQYLSNERGIEAELRRPFDVAKDGEKVVVIVEEETATDEFEAITAEEEEIKPRWYEFWR
jgi:cell division protein FtsB